MGFEYWIRNLYDNLERRGIKNNGDRPILLKELERLLILESENPSAIGYFTLDVEEQDLPTGHKHKVDI